MGRGNLTRSEFGGVRTTVLATGDYDLTSTFSGPFFFISYSFDFQRRKEEVCWVALEQQFWRRGIMTWNRWTVTAVLNSDAWQNKE